MMVRGSQERTGGRGERGRGRGLSGSQEAGKPGIEREQEEEGEQEEAEEELDFLEARNEQGKKKLLILNFTRPILEIPACPC